MTSEVIAFGVSCVQDARMLRVAFVGTFAATLAPSARARTEISCDVVHEDRSPARSPSALPAHRPFHEPASVLLTPHLSGWTEGMLEARELIAENIHRAARGEPR